MSKTCDIDVGERDSPFLCGRSYHCQPCSLTGHHEQAIGYCVNCVEYLCRQCYRVHRIPASSQSHVMLHIDHVTKRHPTVEEIFNDECQIHKEGDLVYYCQDHDEPVCIQCKSQAHKHCTNTYPISDVIENSHQSLRNIQRQIGDLIEKCSTINRTAGANIAKRRRNEEDILCDIKQFRHKINAEFDKLEQNVRDRVRFQNKQTTERLERVSSKAHKVLNNMRNLQEHFNKNLKTGEQSAVFIGMKNVSNLTAEIKELVNEAEKENYTEIYTFQAENKILEAIQSFKYFGELCPEPKPARALYKRSVNVKASDDTTKCVITDLLAIDNMMIMSDYCNSKVKIIEIDKQKASHSGSKLAKLKSKWEQFRSRATSKQDSGKVIAQYITDSSPWNIATISPDLFVVTLPYATKLIYLQLWNKTLTPAGQVDMTGQCFGIAHKNGRLVVSFAEPACIKVLDIRGNILHVINHNELGQPLFTSAKHIAISYFSLPTRVYVYDDDKQNLTCMTMEGKVLNTYYSNSENGQDKIVLDSDGKSEGRVMACCKLEQNLRLIAARCEHVKALLYHDGDKTLTEPSILCYNEANNLLYVQEQSDEDDFIQMYQIEETSSD